MKNCEGAATLKIYDVSLTLEPGMTTYNNEPGPTVQPIAAIDKGAAANVSLYSFGSHTGTHIDAPVHFIPGAPGIDATMPDVLIGPATLLDMSNISEAITVTDLEHAELPPDATRVLLRTRNSRYWDDISGEFHRDFVYLAPDACRWLADRGVRLVGIDYLSIEQFGSSDHATHLTLLGAGVAIIEGLDLRAVHAGQYMLVALPLKIKGGDGSPSRVMLIEDWD
ncbi:MAG: cyclase [Candidatus Chloroheliales bacterium]|nr:MAG: cyclase [Chloroflexota bacterium]